MNIRISSLAWKLTYLIKRLQDLWMCKCKRNYCIQSTDDNRINTLQFTSTDSQIGAISATVHQEIASMGQADVKYWKSSTTVAWLFKSTCKPNTCLFEQEKVQLQGASPKLFFVTPKRFNSKRGDSIQSAKPPQFQTCLISFTKTWVIRSVLLERHHNRQ